MREGMTLSIVNTRRLKAELNAINRMRKEVAILGICKTWIRAHHTNILEARDGHTEGRPLRNIHRGHGGVGFVINPLIPYNIVARHTGLTIQFLTSKKHHTTATVIYISTRTNEVEEAQALEAIIRVFSKKGIIMGDINARLKAWDSKPTREDAA